MGPQADKQAKGYAAQALDFYKKSSLRQLKSGNERVWAFDKAQAHARFAARTHGA